MNASPRVARAHRFVPTIAALLTLGLVACPTDPLVCSGSPQSGPVVVPAIIPAENFSQLSGGIKVLRPVPESPICFVASETRSSWVDYEIAVNATLEYDLRFTLAATSTGAKLHLELDGNLLRDSSGKAVTLSTITTGPTQFATFIAPKIVLGKGTHRLRLVFDGTSGGTGLIANIDTFEVAPSPSAAVGPFKGSAWAVPGSIQAEDFDEGSNNLEYNVVPNKLGLNKTQIYRVSEVNIEPSGDGGYFIDDTQPGEWLTFSINVAKDDNYRPSIRYQANKAGGKLSLYVDDVKAVTSKGGLTATTGWQTMTLDPLFLSQGTHKLKVSFDQLGTGASNIASIDKLELASTTIVPDKPSGPFQGLARSIPGVVEAEDFDDGGNGIGYKKISSILNPSGAYRQDVSVDIAEQNNTTYITSTQRSEWLVYTLALDPQYDGQRMAVKLRYASPDGGGRYSVYLDGGNISNPVQIQATGGWNNFVTQQAGITTIAGKSHRLRVQFDALGNNANAVMNLDAIEFSLAPDSPPPPPPIPVSSNGGKWSSVFKWPFIPIQMALLPNGKVLSWASGGENYNTGSSYDLWDPNQGPVATGHVTPFYTRSNLFCAGFSFLPDGRLLIAGSHYQNERGTSDTNIFDYRQEPFSAMSAAASMYSERKPNPSLPANSPFMNPNSPDFKPSEYYKDPSHVGRWYPGTTPLPNGEIMVSEGYALDTSINDIPEVWQTNAGGGWRRLTGAQVTDDRALSYYPFTYPNLRNEIVRVGPEPMMYKYSTSASGTRTRLFARDGIDRTYGSAVMFRPGKVLVVGGSDPPTNTAKIVDLTKDPPVVTDTGSMRFARRQANTTVLPNGQVLVTGGTSGPGHNDESQLVLNPEVWDPNSGQFKLAAPMNKGRGYHSVALLLPNGQVLSGGGGSCGTCKFDNADAEIYSPPYLFDSSNNALSRPSITAISSLGGASTSTFAYGGQYRISADRPLLRASLIKLGTPTHARNFDQNFNELSPLVSSGNTITVQVPASPTWLTPGYYLLFALDSNNVPSVAQIVKVQ